MSVIKVDGEGNFHKKIYMKDGYPQMVFKDDKLLFPDFCMVNSGGHNSYGDLPYKSTIYGGDLGANNLFQPYSSKSISIGPVQSNIWLTEYYTDTVVYGDGCKLVDTFNLNTNRYTINKNTFPLSSCGDAIALDVSKFREYLSQLDYSSKVFLYCKISADTDTITKEVAKHPDIPDYAIDYENSYEPKIRFGVSYSILYKNVYIEETGTREVTGIYGNDYKGYNYIKYYPKVNGCSNMVDIECTLNDEDIYFGCTDKYLTMVYPNSDIILGNGMSSCIQKRGILDHDTYASYIADKIYITPHFEILSGELITRGALKYPLCVNSFLSGEWGVSFDKQTPKELTLCENLDVNEFWCPDWEGYSLDNKFDAYGNSYNVTSTIFSNNEVLFSANEKVYPFSSQFVQDFYNYASSVGDFKSDFGKSGEANVEKFPVTYFPSYEDYINDCTKQYRSDGTYYYNNGSPVYLDTYQVDLKPSTGAKFIIDDTTKSTQYVNNKESNENVKYGSLLNTVLAMQTNHFRQNKMLVKYEFDARTKFKTVDNHKLPICLTFFNNHSGSNYYYPSYEGLTTLVSSNLDLVNLCGDNWYVNDDWRHYCFTALTNYYGLPRSTSRGANTNTYYTLVPYLTLWGEVFMRNDYKWVSPYEVKNVTTKLYI